jgi:plastocyanin
VRITIHSVVVQGLLLACAGGLTSAFAQGVDVSATVELREAPGQHTSREADHKRVEGDAVVLWLSPLQSAASPLPAHHESYRLVQKDKQFTPHLLVIPTGSNVEFPNQDAFFHNVFSLFNGKRFDLGLYEAGTTRTVRFDREGVSYIFCNIHPGMGAVILSLSTPYFATTSADGTATIHNVPPGNYRLTLWSQNGDPASLKAASKTIQITTETINLGAIPIRRAPDPMAHHTNKFNEPYPPDQNPQY